jgi:uncharacterized membrane protein YeaQ/YmgE (transglycosylase-associated protein family)
MSLIILIIVGAIIGYLATLIVAPTKSTGWLYDIIIGIVGSLLGKWIFADVLGIGAAASAGSLTLAGILWGILGAIVLILILRALRLY